MTTYRITNLILAAFTAAIWTAAVLSWPASADRMIVAPQKPVPYCKHPTYRFVPCHEMPLEFTEV